MGEGFREEFRRVGCWFSGESGGWAEEAERRAGFHDGGFGVRRGRVVEIN